MQPDQQQRIMGYFIEEAKDHLNTIEQGLLNLQSTIEDSEMVNEVFRAAHSIKGGAAMLGIHSIQRTAHSLEDYFKLLKETPVRVDQKLETLLLQVLDTLQKLLEQLQGPFGLTDDLANQTMANIEPVFHELDQHVQALVSQVGGAAVPSRDAFAASAATRETILTSTAPQQDSAFVLIFQRDVPTRLREMLQLFKQPDMQPGCREQLQALCQNLAGLGEQFNLTEWCQLLDMAEQAIANPDVSNRTLAPIIIKDIKQAQELVLAGRVSEIVPCDQLREMVPQPVETFALEDDFSELLGISDDSTDSFQLDTALSEIADEQPVAASDDFVFSNWNLDVDTTATADTELPNGLSAELPFEQIDQTGPEVGMAELNSLADLFEGEVPDLGSTWQEEEVIGETLNPPELGVNRQSETNDDVSNDFSDLLFEESSENTENAETTSDDLTALFGDSFVDEESAVLDTSPASDFNFNLEAASPENDALSALLDATEQYDAFEPASFESASANNAPSDDLLLQSIDFSALESDEMADFSALSSSESTDSIGELLGDLSNSDEFGSVESSLFDNSTELISTEAAPVADSVSGLDVLADPWTNDESANESLFDVDTSLADADVSVALPDFVVQPSSPATETEDLNALFGGEEVSLSADDEALEQSEPLTELLTDDQEDYRLLFETASSELVSDGNIEALVDDADADLAIEELVQSTTDDAAIDNWLHDVNPAMSAEELPFSEAVDESLSFAELTELDTSTTEPGPSISSASTVPDPWNDADLALGDSDLWNAPQVDAINSVVDEVDNLVAPTTEVSENPFDLGMTAATEPSLFEESDAIDPLADLLEIGANPETLPLGGDAVEELMTNDFGTADVFAEMLSGDQLSASENSDLFDFSDLSSDQPLEAVDGSVTFIQVESIESELILDPQVEASLEDLASSAVPESADAFGDLFGAEEQPSAVEELPDLAEMDSLDLEFATSLSEISLASDGADADAITDFLAATNDDLDISLGSDEAAGTQDLADAMLDLGAIGDSSTSMDDLFGSGDTSSDLNSISPTEASDTELDFGLAADTTSLMDDLFDSEVADVPGELVVEALETDDAELDFGLTGDATSSMDDLFGSEVGLEPSDELASEALETDDAGLDFGLAADVTSSMDDLFGSEVRLEPSDELTSEALETDDVGLDFGLAADATSSMDELFGSEVGLEPSDESVTEASIDQAEDLDAILGFDNQVAPTPPEAFDNLFAEDSSGLEATPDFLLDTTPESTSELDNLDDLLALENQESFVVSDESVGEGIGDFNGLFSSDAGATDLTNFSADSDLNVGSSEGDLEFDLMSFSEEPATEFSTGSQELFELELPDSADSVAIDDLLLDNTDDLFGPLETSTDLTSITDAAPADGLTDNDLADLETLLDTEPPSDAFDAAANLSTPSPVEEFADLEALLEAAPPPTPSMASVQPTSLNQTSDGLDEFDDLDKLLEDANEKLGGAPAVKSVRGPSPRMTTRKPRSGGMEQLMRVPVKHLDNLSNLVGELVVNRNSLEQDQERLRQSLDNLLYQVQQLSDVGQRMQDLYERSLLESSLLASRQGNRSAFQVLSRESVEPQSNHATGVEYDPLEMDRFTGFHSLSQEMIELIVRVRESASDIEFIVDETDQVTRMFRQVTTQLQEGLTRSRMVPFAQMADRLPRAVRDNALKYKKQASLRVEGRDTLIDKMILDQLTAPGGPLDHLINNAIAHGIELPDIRQNAGKPAIGQITVSAFHQGNQTVISVSDDGAGVDVERVKAKATQNGLITPGEAATMSRHDVYELLFHPGFTTKEKADDLAGRGVGMDVVLSSLSQIRGTISTDSALGKGTTFTIRLPLTLSISKALCCISDRARIAFPMDGVEDMLDIPKDRIQTNEEGQPCISWRDILLPLRPLQELLTYNRHISRGNVYGGNQEEDMVSVVVLRSAGNFLALQVDQVLGEQEIVIKQLEGPVPKPVGVAGATVLGDGRIMPIADVLELIDLSMGRLRRDIGSGTLWEQAGGQVVQEAPPVKTEPMVLIVDDSITVRELLSMTFNKVGYRVEQARDGQEAWEKLRSGLPCDIVFCDIEMPRMDGLELLSRIQKDPNLSDLPIAMLTSRGADRHRQMAATLGASGYFTKPYLEEALLDAAQRMLKGEKLISATA
jgi:chemotaxis protein histidine kinase CheA/CheY-like chemotaxis protein